MGEIISGFFGMIWALIGVNFQLALPVALVLVICMIIKKIFIDSITKYYVNYIFGIDPRAKKRRLKQIYEIQQHEKVELQDVHDTRIHRDQIKAKIRYYQNELKQEDKK